MQANNGSISIAATPSNPEARPSGAAPIPQTTWRVVATVWKQTPLQSRLLVVVAVMVIAVATAVAVNDLAGSDRPNARWQVLSLVLANGGLLLLGVAAFLHHLTQRLDTWQVVWCMPLRGQTVKLHMLLAALPVLAFASGCLLTAGIALMVPGMFEPSGARFVATGLLYGVFLVFAALTVRDTTRFLYRFAAEQTEIAARARNEATEAQISALQAQMNPHFLFNALNTVASLVRTDARAAERTVENLSQVLRRTLDRSRRAVSTVGDEIDYLKAYLSVESERFGERLAVHWHVDPNTRPLSLPPMTLQPLVENALKHGVGNRLDGGTLEIAARLDEDTLVVEVTDDGEGFPQGHSEGTGLSNLRRRLSTLYGEQSNVSVSSGTDGTRVAVTIPRNGTRIDALNDRSRARA